MKKRIGSNRIRPVSGTVLLLAVLLCCAALSPAFAQTEPETPATPVSLIATPLPTAAAQQEAAPTAAQSTAPAKTAAPTQAAGSAAPTPIPLILFSDPEGDREPAPTAPQPSATATAPQPSARPAVKETPVPTAVLMTSVPLVTTPEPTAEPEPFLPVCSLRTLESYQGMPVAAESFREYVECEEPFTLRYLKEPDWNRFGVQGTVLLITNGAGQSYAHPLVFILVRDEEPPKLYGVHKIKAYIDETVVYKDGVWAEDNADSAPVITVDTSRVNTHSAGTYRIVYTATDYSGNSTSVRSEIVLMEPKYTQEYVYELADALLEKITTPEMTKTEKLRAVFNWGRNNIKYGYGVGKKDWRRAAVLGFTKGTGDCFVFYACTRALLDRIGVEYISIERLGSRTHHYWVLVNMGTGWYHFDTTVANKHKHKCFMWTDEQCQVKPYFWRYDHSLYPEVATEPFDYDAQVAKERAEMASNGT